MIKSTGRAVQSAARALAVTLILLGASAAANAGLLSFASVSGNPSAQIGYINGVTGNFLLTACSECVTVTSPAAAAGTYDLSISTISLLPITFLPTPPAAALYSQVFEGEVEISITNGLNVLMGGTCGTFTIFAEPTASNAVFQCQITPAGVNVVSFPAGPLYLIFAGTTTNPVSTTTTPIPVAPTSTTSFQGISLDWIATLSTSPYSPAGASLITVPPVVGDTQATAVSTLNASGLTLGTVTMQTSTTVAAGGVLSQNPSAGAMVPGGWPIDLVVSSGPPLIAVPNLLPYTSAAGAIAAIKSAGLTVTTITSVPSISIPAGQVTAQNPAAGKMVAPNSAVTFTISSGAATTTPTLHYSGDGSSSFDYTLYPGSSTFVEAFINPEENGGSALYSAFGGAGGFDGTGNAALLIFSYADQTMPVVCGISSECAQPVNGSGTLLIYNVGSCPSGASGPDIDPRFCDWTQGKLGAGAIYAGNSLADLNNNLVSSGTFALSYTPTESFSAASGITTLTPAAAAANFIVSGASAVTAPGAAPVPGPVQVCYVAALGGQCGPLGASNFLGGIYTFGPYFQEFGIDWTAQLTSTPFTPPTSSISVPNVVGDSQTAATAALVAAGLTAGSVVAESSPTASLGTVLSESPVAGTAVAAGSAVNLMVSSGPAPILVPNVTGETQVAATSALTTAGLVLGTVTTVSSSAVASGNVVSESPAAGSSVAAGTAVSLTVSTGPVRGDINSDGQVNKLDLALITSALNTPASGPNDPRDLNHDGVINILDARILVTLCTNPGCAID
jgi:beta-lactam-binding protein with PASTA domain